MSETRAQELVKEGVAAARAGAKEEARRLFLEAVGLDPDNESARLWLASVAATPLEALQHLDRVLTRNPGHAKALAAVKAARVQAGVAAAKAREVSLARTLLRRAVADDPACEKAWVWLASVAETPEEAINALEHAVTVNPHNERTRLALENYLAPRAPSAALAHAAEVFSPNAAQGADETPPPPDTDRWEEVSTAGKDSSRSILLVDDSASVRQLLTWVLEQRGYAVRTAVDGAGAVASLRQDGIPDVLLLDISLPDMDGFQLCRLLRQDKETAGIPVVMLADQSGFVGTVRGRLAGASEIVTKSLELERLLEAVDRLGTAGEVG